jgi:1-phosphatidylinositol-3-phosphate 5-kinase
LINSGLAEEDQPFLSDGGSESWANALESALNVFGDNIARGGWLAGVKRGRMVRKAKRAEDLKKKSEANTVKQEQEDVSTSKVKEKGNTLERQDKELPKKPSDSLTIEQQAGGSDLALQQIRALAARPALPAPNPSAKHLLLCLLPMGTPLQPEDNGFDLVPRNTDCTFTPGCFSLPDSDNTEGGILFGLSEWDGSYSHVIRCTPYL